MELTVFGANGPTGRQVVLQALTLGHHVRAVTRKPEQYPLNGARLDIAYGDVTDFQDVQRVLLGTQAVISTFGVPYSRRKITVYSQGITNITRAMALTGIKRLVCVSSTGVATEQVPGETLFWRKILMPFFRNVLGRTLYDDMQRMEEIVQGSDLDWTIVRPAGLFDTAEPTDGYEVGVGRIVGRLASRADLAQTLIRQATQDQHSRKIIEVITRAGLPSNWTFLTTTFGKKRNG